MKKRTKRKESGKSFSLFHLITIGIIVLLGLFSLNKCSGSATDKTVVGEMGKGYKNEISVNEDSLKKTSAPKEIIEQPDINNKVEISSNRGSFISRSIKWLWQNTLRFLLIVVIIFLIYQVIVIRNENEKINTKLRGLKKSLDHDSGQLHFGEKFIRKSEFDEFATSLEIRLSDLESKNKQPTHPEVSESTVAVNHELREKISETDFFPAPNKEGYFMVNQGSKRFISGQHIFRFEYSDINQAEAIFTVVNDTDSMKYAINYSDAILRNACEIENLMHSNPSKIINITPGLVKKQDDKWVISKKSIIRYD